MNNKYWRSSSMIFVLLALSSYLVEAQTLDGTGSLFGSVTASSEFKAAQVFALNTDKQIQYVVYRLLLRVNSRPHRYLVPTSRDYYRAINLLPGNYQVRVEKRGFESDVHSVVVNEGQNTAVDFSLREVFGGTGVAGAAELVPYDTLYPPGPGRVALEKNCTFCHNENYLPSRHWTSEQWQLGVDLLLNVGGPRSTLHRPVVPGMPSLVASSTISVHPVGDIEITAQNTLSANDRELILGYLTENFGPDSGDVPLTVEI